MPNMSPNKVKMPEQDPNVRNKNFEEVSLGYTKEQAMEEATRCLNCKKPFCMVHEPVRKIFEARSAVQYRRNLSP